MPKHHKYTPKRPRKPLKPTELAVILAALGTAMTGLAALIKALSLSPVHAPSQVTSFLALRVALWGGFFCYWPDCCWPDAQGDNRSTCQPSPGRV